MMGVLDKTCRMCGKDISAQAPHTAFCEPCYNKHRVLALKSKAELEESELENFLALSDRAKWTMVWKRQL